jgi:hypothetical protein
MGRQEASPVLDVPSNHHPISTCNPPGHGILWTGTTAKGWLGFCKGDIPMLEDGRLDRKHNKPPNARAHAHPIDQAVEKDVFIKSYSSISTSTPASRDETSLKIPLDSV